MSENRRVRGAAALLILLAVASFTTAAITITNITEWHIKAQGAPIVKVAGADDQTNYVNVTWTTDNDGSNRTVITLVGFKGDPTYYSDVLRICNKNMSGSVKVSLVYNKVLYGDWSYVKYLQLWLNSSGPLVIQKGTQTGTLGPLTVGVGECAVVSAEVLVYPNATVNQVLMKIQVDVKAEYPP